PRPTTLLSPQPRPPPIPTLSLHDALPISEDDGNLGRQPWPKAGRVQFDSKTIDTHHARGLPPRMRLLARQKSKPMIAAADFTKKDRKSTRLNSSHVKISYAVFCLKKKITE